MARAALGREGQAIASGAGRDAVEWPTLGEHDRVEIVRAALSKYRDEAPSTSGVEFRFLGDPDLEATLKPNWLTQTSISQREWKVARFDNRSIIALGRRTT
jgi:hypothetical protein